MAKTYKIGTTSSTWDCECCGTVWDSDLFITLKDENGARKYKHSHDGHFGSGDWDDSESSKWLFLLLDVLEAREIYYDMPQYTHSITSLSDGVSGKVFLELLETKFAIVRFDDKNLVKVIDTSSVLDYWEYDMNSDECVIEYIVQTVLKEMGWISI